MIRSRYAINIEGANVELLFTLSIFEIARRRGIVIASEMKNVAARMDFFNKLIYLGALNAWEYRAFDDPGLGEFPYKLIDIAEWAGNHPLEYARIIKGASAAIAGKELSDVEGAQDAEAAAEAAVQKKNNRGPLGLFRRRKVPRG